MHPADPAQSDGGHSLALCNAHHLFFLVEKTKHNIPPSEKFFIFSIITKIPFYTKNGKIVRNYLHKICPDE